MSLSHHAPNATDPSCQSPLSVIPPDVEARALLALGVLDHRLATRDRFADPDKRRAYIAQAIRDARAALDGATVGQILAQYGAAT